VQLCAKCSRDYRGKVGEGIEPDDFSCSSCAVTLCSADIGFNYTRGGDFVLGIHNKIFKKTRDAKNSKANLTITETNVPQDVWHVTYGPLAHTTLKYTTKVLIDPLALFSACRFEGLPLIKGRGFGCLTLTPYGEIAVVTPPFSAKHRITAWGQSVVDVRYSFVRVSLSGVVRTAGKGHKLDKVSFTGVKANKNDEIHLLCRGKRLLAVFGNARVRKR